MENIPGGKKNYMRVENRENCDIVRLKQDFDIEHLEFSLSTSSLFCLHLFPSWSNPVLWF